MKYTTYFLLYGFKPHLKLLKRNLNIFLLFTGRVTFKSKAFLFKN